MDSMVVIYNGIELERYHCAERVHASSSGDSFSILSVGGLTDAKNYPYVIKVLSKCVDLDWRWNIAGGGGMLDELQELVREYGIEDRVRFLGYVEDVPERLLRANLFLQLSKWEGFGLAVVEAMAAGCPVMASNVSGLNEILRPKHDEGVLVNCADFEDVVRKLRALMLRQLDVSLFVENAKLRSRMFSFEKMKQKYLECYGLADAAL